MTHPHPAIRADEIAKEQHHVDRVYARLQTLRAEAERAQREGFALAGVRTPGSLVERDAMVYHAARRLRALDAEYEGLVFGRLDLTDGEARYIGRLGLRDVDQEPLVIDWRAPGAAAFYQATAEEPMDVVRRRVIRCAGPRVLDIEDDLLDVNAVQTSAVTVVGDGALIASLARAKSDRMRDIVSTIQREQDLAIRAPAGGVTLIEGGPGTGKTAVALHRAAHLLYRDRRRFEGGGVLLVGPSPVFMSYVERVLPSLGEETVELRALGEIVDGLSSARLDPPALAAIKGALRMRRFLQRAVREAPPGAPTQLRVSYAREVLKLGPAELAEVRRAVLARGQRPNQSIVEARRALIEALWRARPDDVSWSMRRFAEDVADRDDFARFLREWWPVLTPLKVLATLAEPDRAARAGAGAFTLAEASALAASWRRVPDDLSVADVALADELRVLLGDPPAPPKRRRDDEAEPRTIAERYYAVRERAPRPENYDGYAHLLVDEVQDLSPMQWRMLGRRGQQASWTIVGDAAQSSWPDPAEALLARAEALRGKELRRFHLTTNYRNSAEIFEFAAAAVRHGLPEVTFPMAVRQTGISPEARVADLERLPDTVATAVVELLDLVEGTVGVISTTARRDEVVAWLADRVSAESTPRVQVVDGMSAKGMEYDAVVVVAPDELAVESAAGIRVLYVALTRATHRLITVAVNGSPPNGVR